MSRFRQALKLLGKTGVTFVAGVLLFIICVVAGWGLAAFFVAVALIPLTFIVTFRAFRWVKRNALWSLRNRLVVVYTLIGVLPIALLFLLVGLSTWALMSELGIYLANSALERRLDMLRGAAVGLEQTKAVERDAAVPHFLQAMRPMFPNVSFYYDDQNGARSFPANAPQIQVSPGWGNVNGLLVWKGHFYGWAHLKDDGEETTILAPLTNSMVENLVPNLGSIGLLEADENQRGEHEDEQARAGAFAHEENPAEGSNPDVNVQVHVEDSDASGVMKSHLPPPVSRFDVPVTWPSTLPHFHLDAPGKSFRSVIWVLTRPSAVIRALFSGTERLRGFLFDTVVAIAVLFLFVELVALLIGMRLSRRITMAVNQLHAGTQRVTHGDFHGRIAVRDRDQLGELSQSFNQMTENLERLVVVEKEKERLQTELEIAREVQSQLYPKAAPPICGLKLTVRCDPARTVSGDYYDYVDIGHGKLAFAIGDVAGKGISAALLMATLQSALRAQVESSCRDAVDSAVLVSALNKQIYAHTSPEKYATFFFGLFDEPTRTLTYTNAGHLSPLLFRNEEVAPLDTNGTVVGLFPTVTYEESRLHLRPGDLLVCYTDGITEPENAYGEMFGEERLIDMVRRYNDRDDQEIVAMVLEAVRKWTGGPELHDDMTLLLAREVEAA